LTDPLFLPAVPHELPSGYDRDVSTVQPTFDGARVLVFETRRARELASLVTTYGGQPMSAPAMREVPIDANDEAVAFAAALERGEYDIVVLLTGVGTRYLVDVVERAAGSRAPFLDALRRVKVVPRGPKPLAVLRELQVPVWVTVPEPNTWRELLAALDATGESLQDRRVAVQEYGASNPELLAGLEARGATVTRVPVYRWALPEDRGPLEAGVRAIARGDADVALFTTATQVVHVFEVAASLQLADQVRQGLQRMMIASIGPTTSEALREHGLEPDVEPSHPKMGFLAREAAERSAGVLQAKRPS
jgi:uroporphyrinogen-III synthase